MNKKQQVMDFVANHKDEIKTIGMFGLAFIGGIVSKSVFDGWKGTKLVKLLRGSDTATVVTNIETLLLKADIPYEFMYDPDCKTYYMTID